MQSINSHTDFTTAISNDFCIIKATAPWCGPCQRIHPKILDLIPLHPHIRFFECNVDMDDCPINDLIRVLPTFLFYQNSSLKHTITGTDILSINKYLLTFQEKNSSDNSEDERESDGEGEGEGEGESSSGSSSGSEEEGEEEGEG